MSDPNHPVVKMIQELRTRARKDLYNGTLNYEATTALLHRQLGVAEKLNDTLLKGQLYETIGTIELELGNYEQGYIYYLQSLTAFEAVEDAYRIGVMLNNLGEVHRRWGKPQEAAGYYLKARELAVQTGQHRLVVTTFNNEGQVWLAVGDAERAIACLETGLQLADEGEWEATTRQQTVPEIRSGLAEAYALQGHYDMAWNQVKQGLDMATQHNQLHQIARAYQAMAFIAIQEQRDPSTINDYFLMSREHWLKLGAKVDLGHMLAKAGDYWASQHEAEQALASYAEAIDFYEQAQLHTEAERLRGKLSLSQ